MEYTLLVSLVRLAIPAISTVVRKTQKQSQQQQAFQKELEELRYQNLAK